MSAAPDAAELEHLRVRAEAGDDDAESELAVRLRARHQHDLRHPAEHLLERWVDVRREDLDRHPDGFAQVRGRELDGFLIRGVLSPDEVHRFNDRLDRCEAVHGNMGGRLLGMSLLGLPDRAPYFPAAQETRRQLDELFGFSLEERLEAVFEAVGGGRDARLPSEGPDKPYLPATVRLLDTAQGGYRAHCGNEFVETFESYGHLRNVAQTTDALSYFVVTQTPEAGGELVIYDLHWEDTPEAFHGRMLSASRDTLIEAYDKAYVVPSPGDMILFNGGRIWHRVADIEGPVPRITVGGFTTVSNDDRHIYYWN